MSKIFITLLVNVLFAVQGFGNRAAAGEWSSHTRGSGAIQIDQDFPDARPGDFVSGEVIVRFTELTDSKAMERIISSIGGEIIKIISERRKTYLVRLPPKISAQEAKNILANNQEVQYVEPNYIYRQMGE